MAARGKEQESENEDQKAGRLMSELTRKGVRERLEEARRDLAMAERPSPSYPRGISRLYASMCAERVASLEALERSQEAIDLAEHYLSNIQDNATGHETPELLTSACAEALSGIRRAKLPED